MRGKKKGRMWDKQRRKRRPGKIAGSPAEGAAGKK